MKRLDTTQPRFVAEFAALLAQGRETTENVGAVVTAIIDDVRARGDAALIDYTARFDRLALTAETLRIPAAEIDAAVAGIPADLAAALDLAARRIERFHRAQLPQDLRLDDDTGLTLGMRWTALDAVGIYVPGGKAAYPSSVLMNAIPARAAGVGRIAMCVPTPDGVMNPLVLAAARRAGVDEIYRVGGAQAIAALAWGTASIAAVDRVVGPGNAYVAEAKRQVFGRVGIDAIAGPSEVVILAGAGNNARHVAVDCGLTYPLVKEVDRKAYIDSLKTPHGLYTYDEVFDKALHHVVEGCHLIAEAVFGNSTAYQTAFWDWNLDTGRRLEELRGPVGSPDY